MSKQSITYVNAHDQMGQRRHDVVFNFEEPIERLTLLLSKPDEWLSTLGVKTGLKSIEGITLAIIDDPQLDLEVYFLRGMPATGTMLVFINLSKDRAIPLNATGGVMHDWLKDLKVLVTIREDDMRAFVHVDFPTGKAGAELLIDMLTHLDAIPGVLSKLPLQIQYVAKDAIFPGKPIDEPPGTITYELASFAESTIQIRTAIPNWSSCITFYGEMIENKPAAKGGPAAAPSGAEPSLRPHAAPSYALAKFASLARDGQGHVRGPARMAIKTTMQALWAPAPDPGATS